MMIPRKFLYGILLILISACTAAPSITPSPEPSPTVASLDTICLVTDVGKIDDGTFNQYAYEGLQYLAEDYTGVETQYIETLNEADYGTNIQQCIDNQADIVVTVGFLITEATALAAQANPNVYFIGVDQDLTSIENPPANFVGVQAREDQAGFLVGVIAALQANELGGSVIAGVYGIDVPAVKRFRNGYEQGALYINPDWEIGVNILGSYTDSFTDAERGIDLANEYIEQGAVVIFGAGGPTGSAAILAAAQAGIYVIGVDKDEYFTTFQSGAAEGSEYLMTSAVKRVDRGVYDLAGLLIEGRYADFPGGRNYLLDVVNNGVGFASVNDAVISETIFERATIVFGLLIDGELDTGVDPITGDLLSSLETEVTAEATIEVTIEATSEATEAAD